MHLIFDFDGTIADSGRFLEEYFHTHHPNIDVSLLRKAGLRAFLKQHHIGSIQTMIGIRLVKRAMRDHIDGLRPAIPRSAIRELATHHTLSILSSNSHENIMAFLIKENMHQYFRIVHADTSLFGKDRMMARMLKQHHISPEDVVYIGDEDRDIAAARKAGVRVIAVTWGYNERDLLVKESPDALARKPADIMTSLKAMGRAKSRKKVTKKAGKNIRR